MAKKNEPFKIDKYNSRSKRIKNLNKPVTIYGNGKVGAIAVLIFILTDTACVFAKWNLMGRSNIGCLAGMAVSTGIALDLPFAMAAAALKEYLQGLRPRLEKNVILWGAILAFSLAFGSMFVFSFITKDLFFSVNDLDGLKNAAEQAATAADTKLNGGTILYAAAVSGLIPFITSVCSFVAGFFTYDPLKKKIEKMETERIGLQNNLMEIEKAIAEAETKEEYFQEMTEREEKLFSDFMEKLEAEGISMEQVAGVVIMEQMENAQKVTKIFRNSEQRMEKYLKEQQEDPIEQEELIFRGNQEEIKEEAAAETVEELPDELSEEIIAGEETEGVEEQEMFSTENEETYGSEEEK